MTNINKEVGKRLRTFINSLGLKSIAEFCRQAKMERGTVDKILKGKHGPRVETLGQIISAFPELRLNWLVHGDGEMLETTLDRDEIYLIQYYRKIIKNSGELVIKGFFGAVQHFAREYREMHDLQMNANAFESTDDELKECRAKLLLSQLQRRIISESSNRLEDEPNKLRLKKMRDEVDDRIKKIVNLQNEEL